MSPWKATIMESEQFKNIKNSCQTKVSIIILLVGIFRVCYEFLSHVNKSTNHETPKFKCLYYLFIN